MLTLLTATGARPVAWALCLRWMSLQTYRGPVRWVVVDDGPQASPATDFPRHWTVDVLRPDPLWVPGQNTQARNLQAGLGVIDDSEKLVIIEDDDYYAPEWLAQVHGWLDHHDVVGEPRARYYHVGRRIAHEHRNTTHSSLCSTATRGAGTATLREACQQQDEFIDIVLWRKARVKALYESHYVVGIKGLPGRQGIGIGHRDSFKGTPDPTGAVLRKWIGDAAAHYLPFYKGA
jgi:hypothetical protein